MYENKKIDGAFKFRKIYEMNLLEGELGWR